RESSRIRRGASAESDGTITWRLARRTCWGLRESEMDISRMGFVRNSMRMREMLRPDSISPRRGILEVCKVDLPAQIHYWRVLSLINSKAGIVILTELITR